MLQSRSKTSVWSKKSCYCLPRVPATKEGWSRMQSDAVGWSMIWAWSGFGMFWNMARYWYGMVWRDIKVQESWGPRRSDNPNRPSSTKSWFEYVRLLNMTNMSWWVSAESEPCEPAYYLSGYCQRSMSPWHSDARQKRKVSSSLEAMSGTWAPWFTLA